MKHAGIEVRIGRLVVDASRRATSTGFTDAIAEALQSELAARAPTLESVVPQGHAPQIIARHIATEIARSSERLDTSRGRDGAD